jgi:DNA-binding CsgD family transcriptional regulator
MPPTQLLPLPGTERAGGVATIRFARTLAAARSPAELKQSFLAGFGQLLGVPMYGYALVDPATGSPMCAASGNVSPAFIARYERSAKDVDPVLAEAYCTGRPVYNRALMSAQEWEESAVYRRAYHVHSMHHVVEVPIKAAGQITGNVHFATDRTDWDITVKDIRVADALGGVLALVIDAIETRTRVEQERDEALAVLDVTGTAFAVSDLTATEVRLNRAAHRLLANIVAADAALHRLLARSAQNGGRSYRADVELTSGETAVLHGHGVHMGDAAGTLVTVLELQREQPAIPLSRLAVLTPREQDVAMLVIEGLSDLEIAGQLCLSHHTVSQHVRRIYRKLDVESRVGLTRLLLGAPTSTRRTAPRPG